MANTSFMMSMHFSKLKVWQKGMQLAKTIYTITASFPMEEKYGLVSQLRRAAIAIPSNIAEGSQRTSDKDFAHFLLIAKGSLAELETQMMLSQDLMFLKSEDTEAIWPTIIEINKMIHALHSKLAAGSS